MNSLIKERLEKIEEGIVPEGYKNTKIGIIPEDWEVKKLGEISINGGSYGINAPAVPYNKKLPKYLRITDISDDGEYINEDKRSVDDKNFKNFILEKNDIVFARTGNTTGKSYLYKEYDGQLIYAGFLIKFSINPEIANDKYIFNHTKTNRYKNWLKVMSMRSGQPGVNSKEYESLEIPTPPLKEQEEIANILSTWDKAIENIEKLIKEKEIQKKGLMQQITSRQVRMWDEHGNEYPDWEKKKIKDIFDNVTRGNVLAVSKTKKEKDELYSYPVYSSQTLDNGLMGYYDQYLFEDAITWTTDGANAGTVKYRKGKFYCTNVCGVLLSNKRISKKLISEILNGVAWKHVSHVGNPKLMNNIMSEIAIEIPVSLEEQKAIAEILSTADKEIELLNQLLNNKKEEKKGLMQLLLTGVLRV